MEHEVRQSDSLPDPPVAHLADVDQAKTERSDAEGRTVSEPRHAPSPAMLTVCCSAWPVSVRLSTATCRRVRRGRVFSARSVYRGSWMRPAGR